MLRTRPRPAQRAGGERRRPASTPKPDPATAHHRRHTAADAAPPPLRTNSTPPTQRETDPARPRRSARTQSPAHDAAEPAAPRCDRATARTTDASWRTRAPSPTPPPPPVGPSHLTPTRRDTPTAPSSQSQPRPVAPPIGSRHRGPPRPSHPATRTHSSARANHRAGQVREDRSPSAATDRRVRLADERFARVHGASGDREHRQRPTAKRCRLGCMQARPVHVSYGATRRQDYAPCGAKESNPVKIDFHRCSTPSMPTAPASPSSRAIVRRSDGALPARCRSPLRCERAPLLGALTEGRGSCKRQSGHDRADTGAAAKRKFLRV